MPLLELELKKNCCGRTGFQGIQAQYHKDLKPFITKQTLKADVRDINQSYRESQPCLCMYWFIPGVVLVGGIVWSIYTIVNEKDLKSWQFKAAFLLIITAFVMYVVGLCVKRCSRHGGNKQLKGFIKDLNSERVYKKSGIHWAVEFVDGKPMCLNLLKGNPNSGTVTTVVKKRTQKCDVSEKINAYDD